MNRRRYIPQPHPFQQRQRWTGFCVRPDCGLPTEHDVHQHVLEGIKAAPVRQIEPEEEEDEVITIVYTPQLSLFNRNI